MTEWLDNFCGNDKKIIEDVRTMLKANKPLFDTINREFSQGNMQNIKESIKSYLDSKNVYIEDCKYCKSKQIFREISVETHICDSCEKNLSIKEVRNNKSKKCMYCTNDVMPIENAITCYRCANVGFSY